MKILIVDDNVAIQEIIRDIVGNEGHNVRVAGTVGEAVSKIGDFEPDIIMLDSRVGDEDGLHVISRAREDYPSMRLRAILVKGASEMAPTDNPYIRASVDKPFKSSDLVAALRKVEAEISEETEDTADRRSARKREKRERKARKKARRKGLFSRKQKAEPPPEGALDSHGVSFGSSYVIFEAAPEKVYSFTALFNPDRYDIMMVTTDKAKAIKERFTYGSMEVVPLSTNGKAGSLGIHDLGTMTSRIRQFMDGNDHPVVIFDTFGDIIAANGLNQSLTMLQQLISGKTRMCTLCVSVDGLSLTDKDRGILLHSMVEYVYEE
ncbi:MAG: response regulator [Thermoplasmata archaeon]|nr:response regulator [Thermoplasmata archaeon]